MAKSTPKPLPQEEPNELFSFGSGLPFVDKAEYTEKDLSFDISAIQYEEGRGYDGQDRWAITVKVEGRDPEILTLGSNEKRDKQLRDALAYLQLGRAITNVRLRKSGNTYYLVNAKKPS